jgi:hypothetical protein
MHVNNKCSQIHNKLFKFAYFSSIVVKIVCFNGTETGESKDTAPIIKFQKPKTTANLLRVIHFMEFLFR